jgi:tRNA (adenine22-N1)-methyltransferase
MDKRLLLCAELVEGDRVCDVGTDHGYLPCYLVSSGRCSSALACDIGEKPLASAREHIDAQGLSDRVKTVLSDGLDNVPPDGISDIVLAGMGGELIADILGRCSWIKDGSVNIVMQPMTKAELLRQWLYENSFCVRTERACISGRFGYTVMSGRFGERATYECTQEYLRFGLLSCDSDDNAEYLERECDRLERAARGMAGSADKREQGKLLLKIIDDKRKEVRLYAESKRYL